MDVSSLHSFVKFQSLVPLNVNEFLEIHICSSLVKTHRPFGSPFVGLKP